MLVDHLQDLPRNIYHMQAPTFIRGLLGLSAADRKRASVTVTQCPDLDPSGWSGAGDHTTLPLLFSRQEIVAATTGCISLGWSALLSGGHNLYRSCNI